MKRSVIIFGILRVIFDFCMTGLAFMLARSIRIHTDLIPFVQFPIGYIPDIPSFVPFVLGASFFLVIIFAINGLYSFTIRLKARQEFLKIIFFTTVWMMLLITYFFIIRDFFFSRLVLFYAWIFSMLFIFIGRRIISFLEKWLAEKGIGVSRLLCIGEGEVAELVREKFKRNALYRVIGVVSFSGKEGRYLLKTIEELEKLCQKEQVDEIIQTTKNINQHITAEDILHFCRTNHIRYRFVPDLFEVQRSNVFVSEEGGIPVIELRPTPLEGWGRVIKRLFDLLFSFFFLVLLFPFFTIIAIAIKLESQGPVFFLQKRVGYHGKEFWCIKFRTMVKDAEKLKKQLLPQNERQGPLFKIKNDPRITRVGRFLRVWSIDELPQLMNVFIGKVSLVGPRPHLPEEVAQYKKHHRMLFTVKPGITGFAQINGRSSLDFEEEVRFDFSYIQNWSLLLDVIIILKTIGVVLRRENAE